MMVQWYRIDLCRADILGGRHAKPQDDVASMYAILQSPPGMALYGASHLDLQIERCYLAIPKDEE
jgi:hypothetical protein